MLQIPIPGLEEIKPSTLRGSPGYFRVGQSTGGFWWLIDPSDRPVIVAAVTGGTSTPLPGSRLRGWGFSAVTTTGAGAGGPVGMGWLPVAGLSKAGPLIRIGGARFPDVFDPAWAEVAADQARRVCGYAAEDRSVLGWRPDEGLDWAWSERDQRPTLLQLCLSLEPRFAAYHAAWEFVLALHEGSLDCVAEAWQVPLTNKELLRGWTREERGLETPGYRVDHRLWSEQCGRRYGAGVAAALRAAAPRHLVFAPSLARRPSPPWWADVIGLTADVQVRGSSLDEAVEAEPRMAPGPCWVDGFTWADPRVYEPAPEADEPPELTRVERMLRRGREAFRRLATDPAVVGWSWPRGGDSWAGEPLFGSNLVRADGSDAIEHTEALTWLNAQAVGWRRAADSREPR